MAKQANTKQKATNTENCGHEHVDTKNENAKTTKGSKSAKNCK